MEDNLISYFFYYISYPAFILLKLFKIKPNMVSYLSAYFTFLGCISLSFNSKNIFFIFTILGFILDFNDGQLARATNSVRRNNLPLDQLLDLIKISMVLISLTFFFNLKFLYLMTYIFFTFFIIYVVLIKLDFHDNDKQDLSTFNFSLKSIKNKKLKGLIASFVLFEAPFYLALIFTILNVKLFMAWLIWTTIVLNIQIFKVTNLLKSSLRSI